MEAYSIFTITATAIVLSVFAYIIWKDNHDRCKRIEASEKKLKELDKIEADKLQNFIDSEQTDCYIRHTYRLIKAKIIKKNALIVEYNIKHDSYVETTKNFFDTVFYCFEKDADSSVNPKINH